MLRTGVSPFFLEWVGSDIATGAVSSGFSSTLGAHIIYCSYTDRQVDMQVQSQNAIRIVNTSGVPVSGVINFVW